ncbi:MAG: hypothetical protein CVT94_06485 [Bacteroidetes bacterium HGW-Bacteroidetes-11]|nr:MAG: hypothetical protein CVT94_06485 [Bacteroidetes bacterium HGW-Bacteroidetes-11]
MFLNVLCPKSAVPLIELHFLILPQSAFDSPTTIARNWKLPIDMVRRWKIRNWKLEVFLSFYACNPKNLKLIIFFVVILLKSLRPV